MDEAAPTTSSGKSSAMAGSSATRPSWKACGPAWRAALEEERPVCRLRGLPTGALRTLVGLEGIFAGHPRPAGSAGSVLGGRFAFVLPAQLDGPDRLHPLESPGGVDELGLYAGRTVSDPARVLVRVVDLGRRSTGTGQRQAEVLRPPGTALYTRALRGFRAVRHVADPAAGRARFSRLPGDGRVRGSFFSGDLEGRGSRLREPGPAAVLAPGDAGRQLQPQASFSVGYSDRIQGRGRAGFSSIPA